LENCFICSIKMSHTVNCIFIISILLAIAAPLQTASVDAQTAACPPGLKQFYDATQDRCVACPQPPGQDNLQATEHYSAICRDHPVCCTGEQHGGSKQHQLVLDPVGSEIQLSPSATNKASPGESPGGPDQTATDSPMQPLTKTINVVLAASLAVSLVLIVVFVYRHRCRNPQGPASDVETGRATQRASLLPPDANTSGVDNFQNNVPHVPHREGSTASQSQPGGPAGPVADQVIYDEVVAAQSPTYADGSTVYSGTYDRLAPAVPTLSAGEYR
ncbi:hypothetical protein BOX15_Mlig025962g1, partial [Macrostomum lignano]